MAKYAIDPHHLPRMKVEDPMARYLGAKVGDVVKDYYKRIEPADAVLAKLAEPGGITNLLAQQAREVQDQMIAMYGNVIVRKQCAAPDEEGQVDLGGKMIRAEHMPALAAALRRLDGWAPLPRRRLLSVGGTPHPDGAWTEPLPPCLRALARRAASFFPDGRLPDQALVNEYVEGSGIAAHADGPLYEPCAVIVSLESSARLDFFADRSRVASVLLRPRSVVAFADAAYLSLKHGIAAARADTVDDHVRNGAAAGCAVGDVVARAPSRLSVTFRRLKRVARRRRPVTFPYADTEAKKLPRIARSLRASDPNASFPSGDVAGATAFCLALLPTRAESGAPLYADEDARIERPLEAELGVAPYASRIHTANPATSTLPFRVDGVLPRSQKDPQPPWAGEIDTRTFYVDLPGNAGPVAESAFFHGATKTLFVTDAVSWIPKQPTAPDIFRTSFPDSSVDDPDFWDKILPDAAPGDGAAACDEAALARRPSGPAGPVGGSTRTARKNIRSTSEVETVLPSTIFAIASILEGCRCRGKAGSPPQ